MARSTTTQQRPNTQAGPFKKIAVIVLMAGPFLAAGGYGLIESEFPGWASGVFIIVGLFLAVAPLISIGRVIPPLALVEDEQLLVSRRTRQ